MDGGGAVRCSLWQPSNGKEHYGGGKLGGDGAKSFPWALAIAQA
jgi:hypothetical protein